MKNHLIVLCTAIFIFSVSADLLAQTRGPRYNPDRGSSSGASSRASSSRSSSVQSQPSAPSSSSSSSSAQRGSRYNPAPSSSSSQRSSAPLRSSSQSSSVSSSSSSSVSRTTVPRGPRYNPTPISNQLPQHQQSRVQVNRVIYHVPQRVTYQTVYYQSPRDYYTRVNSRYIYRNWIQEPVVFTYSNGYRIIDNYPFYVHRGFRYRYNPVEYCQYELVDGSSYSTSHAFGLKSCSVAYDECAYQRDSLNRSYGYERYFCAEAVDRDLRSQNDSNYYSMPTFNYDEGYSQEQASSYLYGKTLEEIFIDGLQRRTGKCSIEIVNDYSGCEYQIRIGGYTYPETDGSICSERSSAALIGCYAGSQNANAACILQTAIQEGYCF